MGVSGDVSVLAKLFGKVFQGISSPAKIMFSCLCPLAPLSMLLLIPLTRRRKEDCCVYCHSYSTTSIYPSIHSIPFHLNTSTSTTSILIYTLLYFIAR